MQTDVFLLLCIAMHMLSGSEACWFKLLFCVCVSLGTDQWHLHSSREEILSRIRIPYIRTFIMFS